MTRQEHKHQDTTASVNATATGKPDPTTLKPAVGYIRVSTEEQGMSDRFGIEVQRSSIKHYALEHGYRITEWYIDKISGTKEIRPQWDKMMLLIDNPPFEAVITFKSDRVARDMKLYFYFLFQLERKNIALLSTLETFEDEALANIYRALLLFVAEQERKNIIDRTTRGRMVKAGKGGFSGGAVPYGYMSVKGVLVIDETYSGMVLDIFEMRSQGLSMDKIAQTLNAQGFKTRKGTDFQAATVLYILRHEEFYRGNYTYNGVTTKNAHPAILG